MKAKRVTKTSVEKFTEKTTEWANKLLTDKQGYILLCYDELDEDKLMASITSKGSIGASAECLHLCMNKNPLFANIVMAASNAFVQARMMQEEMQNKISKIVDNNGDNQN